MRKLRVFLYHIILLWDASDDKPAARTLYASLKSLPWTDPRRAQNPFSSAYPL